MEPLGDILRQRRRPGDEEAHPAAEARPHLGEHQLVGDLVLGRQQRRHRARPRGWRRDTRSPTPTAQSKILALAPPSPCAIVTMRPYAFSKMRGAAPMKVGLHHGQVLDDLVDAAVDGGREADRQLGGQQHLAERVRHRQPQVLQVVERQDARWPAIASPSYVQPLCRSRTPLGRPVVPEV